MSNTDNTPSLLKKTAVAFVVAGMTLVANSLHEELRAQVIGQGATLHVEEQSVEGAVYSKTDATLDVPVHGAAGIDKSDRPALILGSLLVLAGLSFHALYVVRMEKQTVHVHVRRARKTVKRRRR